MKTWILISLIAFLFIPFSSNAQSPYVLPYPSFMPGSVFYKVNLIKDEVLRFWYFGNFGQFKYNLKLSDKYLVEAKTLFEYKQYLLGYQALEKSNKFFELAPMHLGEAKREGKNIDSNLKMLSNAAGKHTEVLEKLLNEVPQSFTWNPEKENPTVLNLKEALENSISVREKNL